MPTITELNLNPWFVSGFSDGEGYFGFQVQKRPEARLGWQIKPIFEIELHRRDLALLEKLQAFFKGAGGITKTKRTTLQYRVTSVEQISNVIIPHFDKYSLITQKLTDYLLFKKVIIMMEKKEHLTQEGLNTIVAIKSSINKGLSESLKTAFPYIVPVNRPVVRNQVIRDPYWLAGFASAEGCFLVNLSTSASHRLGVRINLRFNLSQHSRDEELMRSLIDYLGCGNAYLRKDGGAVDYLVFNRSDINKIISFFNKYSILGIKSQDFHDWCKVYEIIIENKGHLTLEGLDEIRKIRAGMNNERN